MAVTPKILTYPFSPESKKELDAVVNDVDWEVFLTQPLGVINLAKDLHKRLMAGASDHPPQKDSAQPLELQLVAKFLAELSQSGRGALAHTVKRGLKSLGIEARKRGRPRGRKAEATYARYVELTEKAIIETGVFSQKAKMKNELGTRWRTRFTQFVQEKGWPADSVVLLLSSRTPRNLAIHITAEKFECEYETVYRACRRTAKSAQK